MNNTSLKEYYVKLLGMYENVVNMMTAMNQSLSTNSSEVYVTMQNGDESQSLIRIPSMLYLENKVNELENNFNNLYNMPDTGEAWFNTSGNMYKLNMVKSDTAPVVPEVDGTKRIKAGITDNNFLKDLVFPKTYLRIPLTNLTGNIEKIYTKKIIFKTEKDFNALSGRTNKSYEEVKAALYNLTEGIDYQEYNSENSVPIKNSRFKSRFEIQELPELESGNPWTDAGTTKKSYKVKLDSLFYTNAEDQDIQYSLKPGDLVTIPNAFVKYKVKQVYEGENSIIIEEDTGHITLESYTDNQNMYFVVCDDINAAFNYIDIPLEENKYIAIFVSFVDNNIRSNWSDGIFVNLGSVHIYDENGKDLGTYIDYYNEYCTNIGDLLTGITRVAYPQITEFDPINLYDLQNRETIKQLVNDSVFNNDIIRVLPINKHLIDTTSSEQIINLHGQKSELTNQLTTLQQNIDSVYSTLISTDFNQEVTITQESLRSQLKNYYTQRTTLQKQLNNVINSIASASSDITIAREGVKYRVRGITDIKALEDYIHNYFDQRINIIGIDIEYKYKSPTKDTTNVTAINENVFTDWVKQPSIERQRRLVFNTVNTDYSVEFVDYSSTQNIIKWNQIDIPIVKGEDVVMRIRYKYNIGSPYIDLYTPWSEEHVVLFPNEFEENSDINQIIEQNTNDVVTAKFMQTLINEGYQEHVTNSLSANNMTFYHMPENIYSGFNTADNNLISLKDKLQSMSRDLDEAKNVIGNEKNMKYTVYLTYDDKSVELFNNTINKISIYNTDHVANTFVQKAMSIVIRNTGEVPVKLYSIFPGNIDIPLLLDTDEFYEQYIQHYERVPLYVDGNLTGQTLGQWIYFRQDNPYTGKNIYLYSDAQNIQDVRALNSNAENMTFNSVNTYIKEDYKQVMLGYRKRSNGNIESAEMKWMGLKFKEDGTFEQLVKTDKDTVIELNEKYENCSLDFFKYSMNLDNNYLTRFEDICGIDNKGKVIYLDKDTSIQEFIANNQVAGINSSTGLFVGGFLFPNIEGRSSILTKGGYNDYIEIQVGDSVSVPIMFEYFIDGEIITKITKALYFDIRDSLIQNPKHYLLEVTANYDYTSTGSLINSTSLVDEASLV